MANTLMSLGEFVFGVDTAAFNELSRKNQYNWAKLSTPRAPKSQAIGLGDDMITLSGVVVPLFKGDVGQIDRLRDMAAEMRSYSLVDGTGVVWGNFFIKSISEKRSHLMSNGQPRKQKFTVNLERDYD